jgi:DnaK suppressor protein
MGTTKKKTTTRAAVTAKPAVRAAAKDPSKTEAKAAGKVAAASATGRSTKAPAKPAAKAAARPDPKVATHRATKPEPAATSAPRAPSASLAEAAPDAADARTPSPSPPNAAVPPPSATPADTSASPGKTTAQAKVGASAGFVPRAHPDAELTPRQTQALYEALLAERARLLKGIDEHLGDAISNIDPLADEMDIAQRHTEQAYLMRFADKERKLLGEIANALEKMRTGEYGVCEGTGEPISPKRLELRPWTRYSVKYKEQLELERKQHQR